MPKLNWISELPGDEIRDLLKSVDTILLDIDGVLARTSNILPGAVESVAKLRALGKKIGFVTNNALLPTDFLKDKLKPFEATLDEIVTPNKCLLAYLKKIKYQKAIYAIGGNYTKKMLKDAGYTVIEYEDLETTDLEESTSAVKQLSFKTLEFCKNVGIVYADLDVNLKNVEIQVAQIILKHIDGVQLLTGTFDDRIPLNEQMFCIGPKYFTDALQRWTGVQAVSMAKPGHALKEVVELLFGISQHNRVLMVGDNIFTDITFGVQSGFKTLLVLTGDTKKQEVVHWTFAEELKPDYVAESLEEVYGKIKNLSNTLGSSGNLI